MMKSMVGTPLYRAPELVDYDKFENGFDKSVDVWSMGLILYEMSSGKTLIENNRRAFDIFHRNLR